MADIKFMTVKGSDTLTQTPYYIGIPQHSRILSTKETYELCAERTGFKPSIIRAAFLALKSLIRENAGKGYITYVDGVSSIRNYVRGAFDTLSGPWTKGKNALVVSSVEMDPFKATLAGFTPVNATEGANPAIKSVVDETTGVYDIITGTDAFSIAGSDLGPDTTKTDEYVAIRSAAGVETKATVLASDLQNVRAQFATAPAAGEYTLVVYTRSGLGESYGVKSATRKIAVA